jgi:hypothetical protein
MEPVSSLRPLASGVNFGRAGTGGPDVIFADHNRGRPHASLGPGMPDPAPALNQQVSAGHHLPERCRVVATPILNGLHHEYCLAREAA